MVSGSHVLGAAHVTINNIGACENMIEVSKIYGTRYVCDDIAIRE